jgi:hypothetical protein
MMNGELIPHLRGCMIEAKDLMRLDFHRDFPNMGHGKIEGNIHWVVHSFKGHPYGILCFFSKKWVVPCGS